MFDALIFVVSSPVGTFIIFAGGLLGWRFAFDLHKENENLKKRLGIDENSSNT